MPATNVYIHVNNDVADRILIDPAFKLEKLKEAHEKNYAFVKAFYLVDEEISALTYK